MSDRTTVSNMYYQVSRHSVIRWPVLWGHPHALHLRSRLSALLHHVRLKRTKCRGNTLKVHHNEWPFCRVRTR
jgi:hypothetical protein